MSWIDDNMHAMRHNFFNLNNLVIEDLRGILVNKLKAENRSRLIRRKANVYSFLSPPKHLVN